MALLSLLSLPFNHFLRTLSEPMLCHPSAILPSAATHAALDHTPRMRQTLVKYKCFASVFLLVILLTEYLISVRDGQKGLKNEVVLLSRDHWPLSHDFRRFICRQSQWSWVWRCERVKGNVKMLVVSFLDSDVIVYFVCNQLPGFLSTEREVLFLFTSVLLAFQILS